MFINNKLLVILGPTSTGKTDLAIQLAKQFNGEIISADSRQVYKGLDIGTGKMPSVDLRMRKGEGFWEIDGVKIWMYDVADPNTQYTVSDYVKDTNLTLEKIGTNNKLPIIVGGTGLYIKAITEGLSNLEIPLDENLRIELENLPLLELQNKLKKISIEKWENMNYSDQQNPRRLVRTIEIIRNSKFKLPFGGPKSKMQLKIQNLNLLKIGLAANRDILYKRSDDRVIKRISQGMIEEAIRLKEKGVSLQRFRQLGLEYGVLADFLEGKIKNKEELITILQNKIHGYIRRQQTWFKKEKNINWFDINKKSYLSKIEKNVRKWYDAN